MAKQIKKRPPTRNTISDKGAETLGLTKSGNEKKPWHLNGNVSSRGTGFDKRPENAGRKKKIYTVLKEKGYQKSDITTAYAELAFYSKSELEAVKKDGKKPIITKIVANQFLNAFKDGEWSKIKDIMETIIGKPIQSIHNVNENIEISFED